MTTLIIAAEQGDVDAQNKLGVMYYRGEGVPQDYSHAVSWFRKAAEQGHAVAQYNVGLMFRPPMRRVFAF